MCLQQPLRVRGWGWEVIVFWKHTNRSTEGIDKDVANMDAGTTQEELSEPLVSFGNYERLVMHMFLIPSSNFVF
jgi:hypothetical protein